MATYNVEDLVRVAALKALAQRVNAKFATGAALTGVSDRVTALENVGSQANVLEKIKVNGAEQTITDKAVDITMPTQVSDLTNDSDYQTGTEVQEAINAKISSAYKAGGSKATISALPALDAANEGFVYNVEAAFETTADFVEGVGSKYPAGTNVAIVNTGTAETPVYKYDALAGFVDLSGLVEKETGKGLSTNDYTNADQTKLNGIETGATKVEASETNGNIKINGTEVTVFTQSVATDEQITEMLDEVFGAAA